jgi:hypothetical protein
MPKPMHLSRAKATRFLLGAGEGGKYDRKKGETAKRWANRLWWAWCKRKRGMAAQERIARTVMGGEACDAPSEYPRGFGDDS